MCLEVEPLGASGHRSFGVRTREADLNESSMKVIALTSARLEECMVCLLKRQVDIIVIVWVLLMLVVCWSCGPLGWSSAGSSK